MLDFPITDTHVHLWDPLSGQIRYPWLDQVPALKNRFLPEEYNRACGAVQVERIVFLECGCLEEHREREVEWVTSLAQADTRIQGLVAGAAVERGDETRGYLERIAANKLVKGVRRIVQSEKDPEFCLRPGFIEGLRILPEYGLTFDICINHVQLQSTVTMVRECPNVTFVLDHIGKPDIRNGTLEPWKTHLKALSDLDNVWCKVSGVATEADHANWTEEDVRPYLDQVLECFGLERCMFGGDWPVATLATDYPRWVETLRSVVSGCSEVELRKLFRDNAIEFYRLG